LTILEVVGIVIVNSDGAWSLTMLNPQASCETWVIDFPKAPIRTTLDKKQTEQYAELVSQLAAKATYEKVTG